MKNKKPYWGYLKGWVVICVLNLERLPTLACSPHQGPSELSVCRPFQHSTPCSLLARPDPLRGWRCLVDMALSHLCPQDSRNQPGIWDNLSHLKRTVVMLRWTLAYGTLKIISKRWISEFIFLSSYLFIYWLSAFYAFLSFFNFTKYYFHLLF